MKKISPSKKALLIFSVFSVLIFGGCFSTSSSDSSSDIKNVSASSVSDSDAKLQSDLELAVNVDNSGIFSSGIDDDNYSMESTSISSSAISRSSATTASVITPSSVRTWYRTNVRLLNRKITKNINTTSETALVIVEDTVSGDFKITERTTSSSSLVIVKSFKEKRVRKATFKISAKKWVLTGISLLKVYPIETGNTTSSSIIWSMISTTSATNITKLAFSQTIGDESVDTSLAENSDNSQIFPLDSFPKFVEGSTVTLKATIENPDQNYGFVHFGSFDNDSRLRVKMNYSNEMFSKSWRAEKKIGKQVQWSNIKVDIISKDTIDSNDSPYSSCSIFIPYQIIK